MDSTKRPDYPTNIEAMRSKLEMYPLRPGYGLWRLLDRFRPLFFGALVLQGISVFSETAGFLILRAFIDNVLLKQDWNAPFYLYALGFVGLAVLRSGLSFASSRWGAQTSEGIAKTIRDAVFDHTQRLSFAYHDRTQTGELIQKSTSDIDAVRRFYGDQVMGILRILFFFLVNFVTLLLINVPLAFISIAVVPLITVLSTVFFKRIYRSYENYQDQDAKLSAVLQENLSGVRVVKAFARQEFEIQKFDEQNAKKFDLGLTLLLNHSVYWPISHFICGMQMLLGTAVGAFWTMDGLISPGTFIAYLGIASSLIWPLQQLGRLITQLSTSFVSYGRIAEILVSEQEQLAGTEQAPVLKLSGRLSFRSVSFAYDTGGPVLKDVGFEVGAGQKVALLGETGSGKTTLVNLLPRFYDYTGGSILLDGHPLEQYPRAFLRKNIGIVEQEPFLFSMSIADNIAYSVDHAVSRDEIEAAARKASIHDSIMGFPLGYDTLVGERGVTLSGGQKQRITIARTLLKDPRILILDDSTSSVDAETEAEIRQALRALMVGRTSFVIAHRIESLMDADLILVFKEGRIIQSGTHDTLSLMEGFYRQVFELQTRLEDELVKETLHV